MKKVPIVFAFDSNMLQAAGVCITSLLMHAGTGTYYDIIVLHGAKDNLSETRLCELPRIYGNCSIQFKAVGNEFEDSYQVRGITDATYFRLLAAELLPEYVKFLYSDVDVIFREDLSKYYELELGDNYLAGVNSVPVMNEDYLEHIKTLGLKPEDGYFYAGNLVVNAKQIRTDGITRAFLSHKDKKYLFQDMDIINLTCHGHIATLPLSFCLTSFYYQAIMDERARLKTLFTEEEMDNALKHGTIHYNGPKPWNEVCPNMDIWWTIYRKSIFFDEQFAHDFWYDQIYRIEKMSLWKRVKQVARYFRKGGRM